MTLALLKQAAFSTRDVHKNVAERALPTTATAQVSKVSPERQKTIVFAAGKIIGWTVEFLGATASRAVAPQVAPVSRAGERISALCTTVEAMELLRRDWNGYGSEAPTPLAIENAKNVLLTATSIVVPNRVAPSAQGGVGICFYRGSKYADIECLNTGEILATTSDGTGRPVVWELTPTGGKGALERIVRYINS